MAKSKLGIGFIETVMVTTWYNGINEDNERPLPILVVSTADGLCLAQIGQKKTKELNDNDKAIYIKRAKKGINFKYNDKVKNLTALLNRFESVEKDTTVEAGFKGKNVFSRDGKGGLKYAYVANPKNVDKGTKKTATFDMVALRATLDDLTPVDEWDLNSAYTTWLENHGQSAGDVSVDAG